MAELIIFVRMALHDYQTPTTTSSRVLGPRPAYAYTAPDAKLNVLIKNLHKQNTVAKPRLIVLQGQRSLPA